MIFTAGNLLPQQVVITPLYRCTLALPLPKPLSDNGIWYDQLFGIVMIHLAFQLGFCTFAVELLQADPERASPGGRRGRRVRLADVPERPAAAQQARARGPRDARVRTWIYNDFFWGILLLRTGDKLPVTSALNTCRAQFFTDNHLLAAGSLLVALPTLIVYFALQKQFVAGLTLGSTKG